MYGGLSVCNKDREYFKKCKEENLQDEDAWNT